MRNILIMISLFLLVLLVGCSDKSDGNSTKKDNGENDQQIESQKDQNDVANESQKDIFQDLPNVPTNTIEIVNQSPGKFANQEVFADENKKKVDEELKKLPSLQESSTKKEYDQYFRYLYSISASDFQDPNDLVKKWQFLMYGSDEIDNPKYQFKENYNVEIILDSSGSMGAMVNGKTQMEVAKDSISEFVSTLPEEANVSLRVYGHKGSGKESDKAKSCSSIEQVYGFKGYDNEQFQSALNKFNPSGWTPVADSLKESFESFKQYDNETNTNLIYLVSDGIETCDGDPVKVAQEFSESNVSPIINVIGFNVDNKAHIQLKQVAESSDGIYTTVANKEQLSAEFERAQEVLARWKSWKQNALIDVKSQYLDNKTAITGYSNDWNLIARQQKLRINDLLTLLREKGKITFEQQDELRKRNSQVTKMIDSSLEEILSDLKSKNDQEIQSLLSEIEKKYNSNAEKDNDE